MDKKKKQTIKYRPRKMMLTSPVKPDYYENDFYKWTQEQSKLLNKGDYKRLDIENLIEEIQSLGRQERQLLQSYLKVLLMHMLKVKYQPLMHTHSWDISIKLSRLDAQKTLNENPSLKSQLDEILRDAYERARLEASKETGLPDNTFPKDCPWSIDEAMGIETKPKMKHKKKET